MRPKNCWGRGLRAILCRKCSRGSGSSSCGATAAGAQCGPPRSVPPGTVPGAEPRLRTPRSPTRGAHLRLLTVRPVGPVAEVVGGSHLLSQRPRRGQEEHGESQQEPHRHLDVLRGQRLEPWQARTAPHTPAQPSQDTRLGTGPRTYNPTRTEVHRHPRPDCCRPLWVDTHPTPITVAHRQTDRHTQPAVPLTHAHTGEDKRTLTRLCSSRIHTFPNIHTQRDNSPSYTYPGTPASTYKLIQRATHLKRCLHPRRDAHTHRHMCPEVHTHPFAHPDRHMRRATKIYCHERTHEHI